MRKKKKEWKKKARTKKEEKKYKESEEKRKNFGKKRIVRRMATHRNPNRVISTSLFRDGSREPRSTG